MNKRLIIDAGMHTGKDAEFYLLKGFDVVGIEANPVLAEQVRTRLSKFVSSGRLTIWDVAIADHDGEVEFYVNAQHDDWGTTSKLYARRNERLGTTNTSVKVKSTRFENVLAKHGTPYYLKIDIEGVDLLCLQALEQSLDRPRYVSVEAALTSFDDAFTELASLWGLGYRAFKIVNQSKHKHLRCPNPPLEGAYVDYRFDGTCTGPFGEEAPGEWMGIEKTLMRYRWLLREQTYFGGEARLFKSVPHRLYEILRREPVGWYDFHAKLGQSA